MEIKRVFERDEQLISSLVTVWESSIRATHDFFSETNIREIKKYVFQAIEEIPILVVAVDNKETLAFMGIAEDKLEMLFITAQRRGQGIGFYGSLHRNYLKDYKSGLYSYLTLSGKLWTYLADLNEQCLERRDFLMEQIMEQEGITEELKSRDQMEWVRRANNARSRVDEIILNELVYV